MATENGQAPRNAERQSDLAVMDANEYKQKRRLERILDAMDNIQDKNDEAWELFVGGEITHDAKNIMFQRAVKSAIVEAYNLLLDHQRTVAREAEEGEESGWAAVSDYWVGREGDPIGVIEQQHGEDIPVWGLRDFLETEEFYVEEWTETVKPRNHPARTETNRVESTVPERVSWKAALRLKEFLNAEHDLEVKFEELDDVPTYGFDEEPRTEAYDDDWLTQSNPEVAHGDD